jgi:hypothetical protein
MIVGQNQHIIMTVQQRTSDSDTETPQEAQYRRACRKFYNQSTSFVSDADSSDHDIDETQEAMDSHAAIEARHDTVRAALLLDAIDHLTEGGLKSFQQFLRRQQKQMNGSFSKFQELLTLCGLPASFNEGEKDENLHDSKLLDPTKLERWMSIRNEERRLAHERNIQQRQKRVHELLRQHYRHSGSQKVEPSSATITAISSTNVKITTKADLLRIRRASQAFVQKYGNDNCIATHPLIAGMRKLLEQQLHTEISDDNDSNALCLLWMFDTAVISEAVVAQEQGATDKYVRDAITALTSFLVWIPDHANVNTSYETLAFAVQPSLSDRTLEMILRIMPLYKDLHGRPTGTITTPRQEAEDSTTSSKNKNGTDRKSIKSATRLVRENVNGEHDELDLCTMWLHNAMRFFS